MGHETAKSDVTKLPHRHRQVCLLLTLESQYMEITNKLDTVPPAKILIRQKTPECHRMHALCHQSSVPSPSSRSLSSVPASNNHIKPGISFSQIKTTMRCHVQNKGIGHNSHNEVLWTGGLCKVGISKGGRRGEGGRHCGAAGTYIWIRQLIFFFFLSNGQHKRNTRHSPSPLMIAHSSPTSSRHALNRGAA